VKKSRRRFLVLFGRTVLPLLSLVLASCGEVTPIGTDEEELYYDSSSLWPNGKVDVCWEEWNDSDATARQWVRESVENTWGRVANITFSGWGHCNWYLNLSPQVRIHLSDERPHTVTVGTKMAHQYNGLVLNFTYVQWPCYGAEDCDRYIAVHEFGHVLGFKHEQMRPDTPASCMAEGAREGGYTALGPYDPTSIMNYCAPTWNSDGKLSPRDIAGVQRLYGRRTHSLLSWDGRCVNSPVTGAYVNLAHCAGDDGQRWTWMEGNQSLRTSTRGCLDLPNLNTAPGTPLVSWQCDGLSNQSWTFDHVAAHGLGGLCLQPVPSSAYHFLPPVLRLLTCDDSPGQQWTLTAAHELRNANGSCLQVSTANHETLQMATCDRSAAQAFSLDYAGRIRTASGACVRAVGSDPSSGMFVESSTCTGGLEEFWSFSGHVTGLGGNCLHTGDSTIAYDSGPLRYQACFNAPAETFAYWP
jgi:hypothetical protein